MADGDRPRGNPRGPPACWPSTCWPGGGSPSRDASGCAPRPAAWPRRRSATRRRSSASTAICSSTSAAARPPSSRSRRSARRPSSSASTSRPTSRSARTRRRWWPSTTPLAIDDAARPRAGRLVVVRCRGHRRGHRHDIGHARPDGRPAVARALRRRRGGDGPRRHGQPRSLAGGRRRTLAVPVRRRRSPRQRPGDPPTGTRRSAPSCGPPTSPRRTAATPPCSSCATA